MFCCLPHATTQEVVAGLPSHVKVGLVGEEHGVGAGRGHEDGCFLDSWDGRGHEAGMEGPQSLADYWGCPTKAWLPSDGMLAMGGRPGRLGARPPSSLPPVYQLACRASAEGAA